MAYLDEVEGSGLLPHVYCRKVKLERKRAIACNTNHLGEEQCAEQKTEEIDVTLKLELLANSKNVHSSWLSDYAPASEDGKKSTLFDSLFVQVLPVIGPNAQVQILKPSHKPTEKAIHGTKTPDRTRRTRREDQRRSGEARRGGRGASGNKKIKGRPNLYVAERVLGTNWLPRAASPLITGVDVYNGKHLELEKMLPLASPPLQVSTSTNFGTGQPLSVSNVIAQGKLREEVRNGKGYYIVPLEYKFSYSPDMHNLGFVFYSFLHVPHFLQSNFDSVADSSLYKYEDYVIEGPVNTEIIFEKNEVPQTRESFILPGGELWEGSVHLHTEDNPAPDGYYGNGGFGFNRGWMLGAKHIPGRNQPKLQLVEYPNYKIDDFRGTLTPPTPPNVLGIFSREQQGGPQLPLQNVADVISGFDKKAKKYIQPFLGDNDNEYSKLYLSRDSFGGVRGLFMIDFNNLIRNNSSVYHELWKTSQELVTNLGGATTSLPLWAPEILKKSKLIELKVYRDRINRHNIGKGYAKYKDDTPCEEPSLLIGTIGDAGDYGTISQKTKLKEITFEPTATGKRFFMFSDFNMRTRSAGTYQYRVEVTFKDGTYEFLNDFLAKVVEARKKMMIYYNLSMSGARSDRLYENFRADLLGREYKKSVFKPFYDNIYESFTPDFAATAMETCVADENGKYIWETVTSITTQAQQLLSVFPANVQFNTTLASMVNPQFGSPQGIDLFIKFLDAIIDRVTILTKATKDKPGGGSLTNRNSSNFTNNLDNLLTAPTKAEIYEEHTFDSPSSLYKVPSKTSIFVNYLDVGIGSMPKVNYPGLKFIAADYFRGRCQLDAAKYTVLASNPEGFQLVNIGLMAPDTDYYSSVEKLQEAQEIGFSGPQMKVVIQESDTLRTNAFSYLTPSFVYYADGPSDTAKYFSSFNKGDVQKILNGQLGIVSSPAYNNADYDALFGEIINYSHATKENEHAHVRNILDPLVSNAGTYKTLMSNLGITLHDSSTYRKFFDKEPGAVNMKLDGVVRPFDDIFPLKLSDYSSGTKNFEIGEYSRKFLLNKNNILLDVPHADIVGYKTEGQFLDVRKRPNNFKLARMYKNRVEYGKPHGASPRVKVALNDTTTSNNSFIFFHYNMTVQIEVFRAFESETIPKNDEAAWSLLTEQDVNSVETNPARRLLCRFKYYNKKMLVGVDIPIIDEYFVIGAPGARPSEVSIPLESGFTLPAQSSNIISAWSQQNQINSALGTTSAANQQIQQQTQGTTGPGGPGPGPQSPGGSGYNF